MCFSFTKKILLICWTRNYLYIAWIYSESFYEHPSWRTFGHKISLYIPKKFWEMFWIFSSPTYFYKIWAYPYFVSPKCLIFIAFFYFSCFYEAIDHNLFEWLQLFGLQFLVRKKFVIQIFLIWEELSFMETSFIVLEPDDEISVYFPNILERCSLRTLIFSYLYIQIPIFRNYFTYLHFRY